MQMHEKRTKEQNFFSNLQAKVDFFYPKTQIFEIKFRFIITAKGIAFVICCAIYLEN
jgi:hypothetical protein